jgi:DNA-binding PadR family transcriptional regulator
VFWFTEEIPWEKIMKWLSRKEELLLLSIWRLQDNAYGVTIREQLAEATERYWSIGAIYDVLDRLARKGLVTTSVSSPLPERGGRSRRMYRVTSKGFKALEDIRQIQKVIWANLPKATGLGEKA